MTDQHVVFLTATESKSRFSLRLDGEAIGDILLNPSTEAEKRLLARLSDEKFGSKGYAWFRGLLHTEDPWPLLFLRDEKIVQNLKPSFFSESRIVSLPWAFQVEGPLVPEEGTEGYAQRLVEYKVGPVSRVLRGTLLQRGEQESLTEISTELVPRK